MNEMKLSHRNLEPEPSRTDTDEDFTKALESSQAEEPDEKPDLAAPHHLGIKKKKPNAGLFKIGIDSLQNKKPNKQKPSLISGQKSKALEGKGQLTGLEGKGLEGKGLEGKGLEGKGLEGKGQLTGLDGSGTQKLQSSSPLGSKKKSLLTETLDGLQGQQGQQNQISLFFNADGAQVADLGKVQGTSGLTARKGLPNTLLQADSEYSKLPFSINQSDSLSLAGTGKEPSMNPGSMGTPGAAPPHRDMPPPVGVPLPPAAATPVPSAAAMQAGHPSSILPSLAEKPRQYRVSYKGKVYNCDVYGSYRCDVSEVKSAKQ
ncbi:MAG: hypothetical protein OXC07_09710 [Kistimonas sp.]|nr:hypothetical protein [Kistimonas sp.]